MKLPKSKYLAQAPTHPFAKVLAENVILPTEKKFRDINKNLDEKTLGFFDIDKKASPSIKLNIGAEIEARFFQNQRNLNFNEDKAALKIKKFVKKEIMAANIGWKNNPISFEADYFRSYLEIRLNPSKPALLIANFYKAVSLIEKSVRTYNYTVPKDERIGFDIKSSHYTISLELKENRKQINNLSEKHAKLRLAALSGIEQVQREGSAFTVSPAIADGLYNDSVVENYGVNSYFTAKFSVRTHNSWDESRLNLREKETDPILAVALLISGAWQGIKNGGRVFAKSEDHPAMSAYSYLEPRFKVNKEINKKLSDLSDNTPDQVTFVKEFLNFLGDDGFKLEQIEYLEKTNSLSVIPGKELEKTKTLSSLFLKSEIVNGHLSLPRDSLINNDIISLVERHVKFLGAKRAFIFFNEGDEIETSNDELQTEQYPLHLHKTKQSILIDEVLGRDLKIALLDSMSSYYKISKQEKSEEHGMALSKKLPKITHLSRLNRSRQRGSASTEYSIS